MRVLPLALFVFVAAGCSSAEKADPAPPCERECQDGVALRALRETMKLTYNLTLQGNPVGAQDESTDCPGGGSARIFGTATSNAVQGATEVDLTYELSQCAYSRRDESPKENYDVTLDGSITQVGTIVVQPGATTALIIAADPLALTGTVYDPPIAFDEPACTVQLGQSGNDLSGDLCGRSAGVDL